MCLSNWGKDLESADGGKGGRERGLGNSRLLMWQRGCVRVALKLGKGSCREF